MKKLLVKLKKSPIGYTREVRRTLQALGLKKVNQVTVKPNNSAVSGMIRKVKHLLEVRPLEENEDADTRT